MGSMGRPPPDPRPPAETPWTTQTPTPSRCNDHVELPQIAAVSLVVFEWNEEDPGDVHACISPAELFQTFNSEFTSSLQGRGKDESALSFWV